MRTGSKFGAIYSDRIGGVSPTNILRKHLVTHAAIASLLGISPAFAQSTQPPQAAGEAAAPGEIIVTAQKKSEKLLDVPVPITALDPSALTSRNQQSLRDYFAQVPGLSLNAEGSGQTVIIIRGIATADLANPTVGVSIDDVPFGSSTGMGLGSLVAPDLDPADLAQIEVLKGPQGTLYGASSLGGLIKYVTADPSTKAFSGRIGADVDATVSGGIGYGLRGGMNVPVSDTVALRVSGFSRETPGYVDNIVDGAKNINSVDVQGGHAILLWRPTEAWSFKLGALVQHTKGHGFDGVATSYDQVPVYGYYKQSQAPGSGQFESTIQLYSLDAVYHAESFDITSVTGYGINKYVSTPDFHPYDSYAAYVDPTADTTILLDRYSTNKFSQELRISADPGATLEWLAGLFYDHENTRSFQSVLAEVMKTGVQKGVVVSFNYPNSYEEGAIFGSLNFHLTDKFSIQGGVRYVRNHQIYNEQDAYADSFGIPVAYYHTTQSDSSTTFQVTPSYKLDANNLIYARVASGYRPGGINADIPEGSTTPRTYTADTTMNYEIGTKGSLLDRTFTYDLSVYNINWNNIQIQLTDPVTYFLYYRNAEKARSRGVEFALAFAPVRSTRLAVNGNYGSAILTQAIPSGGSVGPAGSRLPYSPHFQGSGSIDQDFALPDGWLATLGATVSYVGSRYQAVANDPTELRIQNPGYTKLDLRLNLTKGQWQASLFGKNVTNTRGTMSTLSEASPVATTSTVYDTVYIQPATFGVSLQRKF